MMETHLFPQRNLILLFALAGISAALLSLIMEPQLLVVALLGVAGCMACVLEPTLGFAVFVLIGRFSNIPFPIFQQGMLSPMLLLLFLTLTGLLITQRSNLMLQPDILRKIALGSTLALGALLLLGVIYTSAPNYGLEKAWQFFIYTQAGVVLAFFIARDNKTLNRYFLFTLMIVSVLSLFALSTLVSSGLGHRISALGGGPNVFSRFTAFGALICCYFSVYKRNYTFLAGTAFFVALTFMTGSRGSTIGLFLALAVFAGLYALKMLRSQPAKTLKTIFVVIILLAVVIAFTAQMEDLSYVRRFRVLLEDNKGSSVTVRAEALKYSFSGFINQPWTGYGTGSFETTNLLQSGYAHNIFAELAYENGLPAIVAFILFILMVLLSFLLKPKDIQANVLAAMFVFALIVAQVSGDLTDSRLIWYMGGLLLARSYYYQCNRSEEK